MELISRLATLDDVPRLTEVMDAAISELQRAYLDDAKIEASRAVMGIDTQLIEDGTHFVIETADGDVAGCGGSSRRATMYGNDHSPGRDAKLLDPDVDAARVRAMYTSPAYARRGSVGGCFTCARRRPPPTASPGSSLSARSRASRSTRRTGSCRSSGWMHP